MSPILPVAEGDGEGDRPKDSGGAISERGPSTTFQVVPLPTNSVRREH